MACSANKLTPKQESAILALLSSRSVEEASKIADIALRTLYRWLADPEFNKAYRRAKRAAFGQAISRLQQGSAAAATVMLKLMVDGTVPPSTRLRAADCVFGHARNAIETEEIEARVAALEQAAELSGEER